MTLKLRDPLAGSFTPVTARVLASQFTLRDSKDTASWIIGPCESLLGTGLGL